MRSARLASCLIHGLLATPLLLASRSAAAEAPVVPEPNPAVERPMTPFVDNGLLLGRLQSYVLFTVNLNVNADPKGGSLVDLSLGGGLGLTDRLMLDGSVGTLSLSPGTRFHLPQIGLTFGLVDTKPFELDVTGHVTIATDGVHVVEQAEPGILVVARGWHRARLDAAVYLPVSPRLTADTPTTVGLRAPLSLAVQFGPRFYAALSSGLTIADLGDAARTTDVSLGISFGAKGWLGGGKQAVVVPSITWPRFIEPANPKAPLATSMVVGMLVAIVIP